MNFVINNGTYELVIPSSTPFNIHLERSEGGYLALFRRTSGEKWDLVKSLSSGALVIDIDVANNIEREYLVRSEGRPTMCVITTAEGSGEVEIPDGGAVISQMDM